MQTISQTSTGWIARTGSRIDRIRINSLQKEKVGGISMWVKRRTASSRWLVPVANSFFRLAGNPVRVLPTGAQWQAREVAVFQLLNGNTLRAGTCGERSIYCEPLPGIDLVELSKNGLLSNDILRLVGQSLGQIHQTMDPVTGQPFSHGDPHLGNALYNAVDQSVRWIDFETEHLARLSREERHADDLLVFLLDLAGRVNIEKWVLFAPEFLKGYPNQEVFGQLKKRLIPQVGFGAIWWSVRSSYLSKRELERRVRWLHDSL